MPRTAPATSYDEVPYAGDPYPASHPAHLKVVATLAGLSPARADRARVLELGCARGGNLIPMAVSHPGSSFLGIDNSAGQVATARTIIEALGLENILIRQQSILDAGDELGKFDYIICHGTYSWVAEPVREKILEIFARNLSENGVAYLGYNTYPGWRMRQVARELMVYHASRFEKPQERAFEARRVLELVAASAAMFDRAYASCLGAEVNSLRELSDSHLLHDHLEETNEPVYFHELVERAHAHGLKFVSEVQQSSLEPRCLPPQVLDGLRQRARDEIEFEQFLDFLINRKFRQSVFCHRALDPRREARIEELHGLEVAASQPMGAAPVQFQNERLLRAVLSSLAKVYPAQIPLGWLIDLACRGDAVETAIIQFAAATRDLAHAGQERAPDNRHVAGAGVEVELASDLLCCYKLKLVEIRAPGPPFVWKISDKPVASPLARYQARLGNTVTNLRHEAGQLNDVGRIVLQHLDGRHDRSALLDLLHESQRQGRLVLTQPRSTSSTDLTAVRPDEPREKLGLTLDRCLESLVRFALLIG
jgi:SAM-dependent methyltransferase